MNNNISMKLKFPLLILVPLGFKKSFSWFNNTLTVQLNQILKRTMILKRSLRISTKFYDEPIEVILAVLYIPRWFYS